MNPELRVVTKLTLRDLWEEKGSSLGGRTRHLGQDRVRQLLREGSVRFVVADCGLPLKWVSTSDRFTFGNSVRAQIAEPEKPIYLDQFPQNVAYVASQWQGHDGEVCSLIGKAPLGQSTV